MAGLLSGVLPAIYSRADALKRGLLDFAQNPVASLEQTAGGILDAAKAQEQRMGQAFANPQRPLKVTDPNALAQATQAMMAGPLGFAPAGITVWHGSPHTFSKFDASKIGTGEGAQAYGHGLYLAEAPAVAKEYAKLDPAGGQIPSAIRFVNGQEVQPGTGAYKAASLLDSMTLPQARKLVSGWVSGARPDEASYFKEVADTLAAITSKSSVKQAKPSGNLYKVDLPDEAVAKMLDWDKPLSQQSKEVQKAWQATKKTLPPNAIEDLGGDLSMLYGKDVTPADFLGTMQSIGGRPDFGESLLKQQGIPGIRYLDQGSRGTGQGTSNFVVFPGNEGLLSILERNGKPVR